MICSINGMGELKLDTPPEKMNMSLNEFWLEDDSFPFEMLPLWGFHTSNCPGNVMFSQVHRIGPVTLRCLGDRPGWGFGGSQCANSCMCGIPCIYWSDFSQPQLASLAGKSPYFNFIRKNTSSIGWFAIVIVRFQARRFIYTWKLWMSSISVLKKPSKRRPNQNKGSFGFQVYIFTCLFVYILILHFYITIWLLFV